MKTILAAILGAAALMTLPACEDEHRVTTSTTTTEESTTVPPPTAATTTETRTVRSY